ncbi:DUF427 domain-containing protein [Ilumatobacter sp.]|uniref:DUF427 domain-containing protein n=1 Tax=Ilumatobacter sp. TaxID=1967498 RepID=UPI00375147C2
MRRRPEPDRREGTAPNGKPFESVWEFPRPPSVVHVDWRIRVAHAGVTIVDAPRALRVLETSQPPAYYVDPEFVDDSVFVESATRTFCEWKGLAVYASVDLAGVDTGKSINPVTDAAWTYRTPTPAFTELAGHWAFYAQRFDECWVDDELVAGNDGLFYGGWITNNVTGPFKGGPGTLHW